MSAQESKVEESRPICISDRIGKYVDDLLYAIWDVDVQQIQFASSIPPTAYEDIEQIREGLIELRVRFKDSRDKVISAAHHIYGNTRGEQMFVGKNPRIIASSIVYLAGLETEVPISQLTASLVGGNEFNRNAANRRTVSGSFRTTSKEIATNVMGWSEQRYSEYTKARCTRWA